MFTCAICRFECPLDDMAIGGKFGAPICVRCFTYRAGSRLTMPRELRRQLEACLVDVTG